MKKILKSVERILNDKASEISLDISISNPKDKDIFVMSADFGAASLILLEINSKRISFIVEYLSKQCLI